MSLTLVKPQAFVTLPKKSGVSDRKSLNVSRKRNKVYLDSRLCWVQKGTNYAVRDDAQVTVDTRPVEVSCYRVRSCGGGGGGYP